MSEPVSGRTNPHSDQAAAAGRPQFIGMSHDIADRNIRRFQQSLRDGTGNPDICREMIDKWLDYRKGPNEPRYL